jgi:26S proteasome regulatory subunit T4
LVKEANKVNIIKIYAKRITKHGEVDYDAIARLEEDFNGTDLRNADMFAIRAERNYVL